jgi:hypothetical protein
VTAALALWVTLAVAAGCSAASRIEGGVFRSAKGYSIRVPGEAWRVAPRGQADLELRRDAPPGAMLANATCGGPEPGRPLPVLTRHLVFGLTRRTTLESDTRLVDGRPATHSVVRGLLDGTDVTVEAVVSTDERCVHDFLYVAPTAEFEAGRGDFRALVDGFSRAAP